MHLRGMSSLSEGGMNMIYSAHYLEPSRLSMMNFALPGGAKAPSQFVEALTGWQAILKQ